MEIEKVSMLLTDQGDPNEFLPTRVVVGRGIPDILGIAVEGHGDFYSENGHGIPIVVEQYHGEVRVLVWSDINKEDPTHIISLEKAKESNRVAE